MQSASVALPSFGPRASQPHSSSELISARTRDHSSFCPQATTKRLPAKLNCSESVRIEATAQYHCGASSKGFCEGMDLLAPCSVPSGSGRAPHRLDPLLSRRGSSLRRAVTCAERFRKTLAESGKSVQDSPLCGFVPRLDPRFQESRADNKKPRQGRGF